MENIGLQSQIEMQRLGAQTLMTQIQSDDIISLVIFIDLESCLSHLSHLSLDTLESLEKTLFVTSHS
jgi:hypothetical protein